MLSGKEVQALAQWQYSVVDVSITTQWFTPLWQWIARRLPSWLAPNVITALGLLCNVVVLILAFTVYDEQPFLIGILCGLLVFAYQVLDACDGIQARQLLNSSPVGELWDHACDSVSGSLLSFATCRVLRLDNETMVACALCFHFVFAYTHAKALNTGCISFGRWTGPGEIELLNTLLLALAHPLGLPGSLQDIANYGLLGLTLLSAVFAGFEFVECQTVGRGLLIMLLNWQIGHLFYTSEDVWTNLGISLFGCILSVHIIALKMAGDYAQSRIWLALLALAWAPLCSLWQWSGALMCALYLLVLFAQLCIQLELPMFSTFRTRLIVGHWCQLTTSQRYLFARDSVSRIVLGVKDGTDAKARLLFAQALPCSYCFLVPEKEPLNAFVSRYHEVVSLND